MTEAEYTTRTSAVFKALLKLFDSIDPDVAETDSTGDMLTVTAKSGEKVIVNTQRAVHQLWVAGKGAGIHFSYDAAKGLWLDDKGKGLELFAWVKDCVAAMTGTT